MKRVVDTTEEILDKDTSTQTEPITIIETQEENMPEIIQGELKVKRDEYIGGIRKAKTEDYLVKKRGLEPYKKDQVAEKQAAQIVAKALQILSGAYQVETGTVDQEPQETDASFYDKCVRYVAQVYPNDIDSSHAYSGVGGTLQWPVVEYADDPTFDVEAFSQVLKNIFRSEMDNDDTEEAIKDNLTLRTAAIYKVCVDNEDIQNFMQQNRAINFIEPSLLRTTILNYLTETSGEELAGEVFNILDNTN